MRLRPLANGFAAATVATLMSGAAFAQQALEIVGQPIDKLTGFQPAVTEMAHDLTPAMQASREMLQVRGKVQPLDITRCNLF